MIKGLWQQEFVILDGAMGTMLQQRGLRLGECPELLCVTAPEVVESIHREYLEAGSNVLYTNSFGANAVKLEHTGYTVEQIVSAAVGAARRAIGGGDALAALDVGPLGMLLEPMGTLRFEDAYALFARQVKAGEAAGADLIVLETMTDLYEMKAALLAAKEQTRLPVVATMTFEENGRTFSGCGIAAMAEVLEGLGADAIGINCSLGPGQLLPMTRELARLTVLPLVVKPNAGLPNARDGSYSMTPKEFAEEMRAHGEAGAQFLGGCCGTTPAFIREMKAALTGVSRPGRQAAPVSRLCTPTCVVELDGVRIIGERINPTGKKRFQQALLEHDLDYVMSQGVAQTEAGAQLLDVNVGVPGLDEAAMMRDAVKALQSVTELPLQIDSGNPTVIEAGLRVLNGKGIVNSVNGDQQTLDAILPVVKKYGAAVVGLTLDKNGIPETAEQRFAIAKKILTAARRHGIPDRNVFIDCLTLTVSAQQSQAVETLKAVRMVKERLGLHTVLGVSNISFGLPRRELLNVSFLTLAMENGLDLPILNPNIQAMTDAVAAFNVLHGRDPDSQAYIARFGGEAGRPAAQKEGGVTELSDAVRWGLREETRRLTMALLETRKETEIINELLIPALDAVGERFERGEIFLPQMVKAADAACEAFEVIKTSLLKKGGAPVRRGKILLATVKGDIHDIGKNIVKVILENYGFQVIDLRRDVEPQAVVETVCREQVPLVGLSALMTTTLGSMAETIRALRAGGVPCKIVVGGAVLTEEYAMEIGADYYAKDAKRTADIAKEVFGGNDKGD